MDLQGDSDGITSLRENEIIQLHDIILFTWLHIEPDPTDTLDQIFPILLHRPTPSIRITRLIYKPNIVYQDTTELDADQLRVHDKGKRAIATELHLNSNPMLVVREATLKSLIINTEHDLTGFPTKIDRLTRFLFTIYNFFLYSYFPKFRDILPIMSIKKELLHIQNTGMIIKSDIQTGHMKLLRVILKELKETIKITGTLRLKYPAALTGHIQTGTHILIPIIVDRNMTVTNTFPITITTILHLLPGDILKPQQRKPGLRIIIL